jgi:hypothetical protein
MIRPGRRLSWPQSLSECGNRNKICPLLWIHPRFSCSSARCLATILTELQQILVTQENKTHRKVQASIYFQGAIVIGESYISAYLQGHKPSLQKESQLVPKQTLDSYRESGRVSPILNFGSRRRWVLVGWDPEPFETFGRIDKSLSSTTAWKLARLSRRLTITQIILSRLLKRMLSPK